MTKISTLIIIGLLITLGCVDKKDPLITIVNIGHGNRVEIGRQLRIINKLSPKIIALDFLLVPDSLEKDSVLLKELEKAKNTVQVVNLYNLIVEPDTWDSLEVSHQKFIVSNHGFANLTTEDSVVFGELPMKQIYRSQSIYSFGYVVAQNSFGVKEKYQDTGFKELKFDLNGIDKKYKLITKDDLYSGKFKKEDFTDRIVIMGYIGEKEDYFYLDKRKKKKINGVEVHAALINEIIDL